MLSYSFLQKHLVCFLNLSRLLIVIFVNFTSLEKGVILDLTSNFQDAMLLTPRTINFSNYFNYFLGSYLD